MNLSEEKPPNKNTIAMGDLIRKAREEAGLTQEQLAIKIYRKRLAVYEMETGKVEISAWTIPLLAFALNKPISYFYPKYLKNNIADDNLSELEQELLIQFRLIWNDDLRRLAIKHIRNIAEFNPEDTILDSLRNLDFNLDNQTKLHDLVQKRPGYEKFVNNILELISKINIK